LDVVRNGIGEIVDGWSRMSHTEIVIHWPHHALVMHLMVLMMTYRMLLIVALVLIVSHGGSAILESVEGHKNKTHKLVKLTSSDWGDSSCLDNDSADDTLIVDAFAASYLNSDSDFDSSGLIVVAAAAAAGMNSRCDY